MKKVIFSILIFCFFTSCTTTLSTKIETFSVEDALGRKVAFSEYPKRIVIAGKQTPTIANFFYLFSSKSDRLLAIENRSQSPSDFLSLIDKNYETKLILEKGAGVEQIAPLGPDLVILATSMREEIGNVFDEVGIPVIYVSFEDREEIYAVIQMMGKILESETRAKELCNEYLRIYKDINDQLPSVLTEKTVLLLQTTTSDNGFTFQIPAADWLQTKMLEDLKAFPVWKSASISEGWAEINIEQIFSWNPKEVMIINYQGKSLDITNKIKINPNWAQYIAENEIALEAFPYDYSSWDQPDSRWILGYAWMAAKLYPSEISNSNLVEIVRNFYTFFYDLDEKIIDTEIIPLTLAYF